MGAKIEIYQDQRGEYRFRVKAKNGEIVASGESYPTRSGAKKGVKALVKAVTNAKVVDMTKADRPADS